MFVARGSSLLLLLFAASISGLSVEDCKNGLREARETLKFMAKNLVQKEHADYKANLEAIHKEKYTVVKPTLALFQQLDGEDPKKCPPVNRTFSLPGSFKQTGFEVPSLTGAHPSMDPFALFVSALHETLAKEDDVCDGPAFTSIASITEEQLLGFGALFLTQHSHFMCPLCHKTVDLLRTTVLQPNILMHADDEVMFRKMVSGQLPSTRAICSTLLPSCYEAYHNSEDSAIISINMTGDPLLSCSACGLCMTGTTLLEHQFLLDQKAKDKVQKILNEIVFNNVCAEMCLKPPSVFGNFTYQGCMKTMNEIYTFGVTHLQRLALPNHLCALQLGVCAPNDTPNLLHCFPDLCTELPLVADLLSPLCDKTKDLPTFLAHFNIPAEEYEKTVQRARMFDEL
uniref:Saposin B-type domain-containing protein n=1 Tax=Steinernema glaseri TaxID=37863 RepID=A0A1I7YTT7_9BILA